MKVESVIYVLHIKSRIVEWQLNNIGNNKKNLKRIPLVATEMYDTFWNWPKKKHEIDDKKIISGDRKYLLKIHWNTYLHDQMCVLCVAMQSFDRNFVICLMCTSLWQMQNTFSSILCETLCGISSYRCKLHQEQINSLSVPFLKWSN